LLYAGRTRNGFTPALRMDLMKRLRPLQVEPCPFANLPEKKTGRWGQGLTAVKMKECQWLRPVLVGQFEFVEWTADLHLRHTRFIALRDDKKAVDEPHDRRDLRRQLLRLRCANIFARIVLVAHVMRILQRSVLKSRS
jgi:ATP-dependent DNA ligase